MHGKRDLVALAIKGERVTAHVFEELGAEARLLIRSKAAERLVKGCCFIATIQTDRRYCTIGLISGYLCTAKIDYHQNGKSGNLVFLADDSGPEEDGFQPVYARVANSLSTQGTPSATN